MLMTLRLHAIVALIGFFALGVCAHMPTGFAPPNVTQTVAHLVARQDSHNHSGNGRGDYGNNDSSSSIISTRSTHKRSRTDIFSSDSITSFIPSNLIPQPTNSDTSSSGSSSQSSSDSFGGSTSGSTSSSSLSSSDPSTLSPTTQNPVPTTADQSSKSKHGGSTTQPPVSSETNSATPAPTTPPPEQSNSPTPQPTDSSSPTTLTSSSPESSTTSLSSSATTASSSLQNTGGSTSASSSGNTASPNETLPPSSTDLLTSSDATSSAIPTETAMQQQSDGNSSSKNDTGAIVGGVVGGVVGLALIAGLGWFWRNRRRKQAAKNMPFYADEMVDSDFRDPSQTALGAAPMRPFVPPGVVMEDEPHSDLQSQPSQGYYDSMYAGQYTNQPPSAGYEDYNASYGTNTETSSTTAPPSDYVTALMAQRARANTDYDYGTEREEVPSTGRKPDAQDDSNFYGKPDSRE